METAEGGETVGEKRVGEVEQDGDVLDEEGRMGVEGGDGFLVNLFAGLEKGEAVGDGEL